MTPKFRAWDKSHKRIIDVSSINFRDGTIQEETRYAVNRKVYLDDVVLMQYTGVKDKDGVEIYEGDILEVEKNEDGTYKGTINGNVFFDRFQGYSSKIKVAGMHDVNTIRYWNNHIRIIGNVYENPELEEHREVEEDDIYV